MPLSLEDKLAIMELMARYNHAIDSGDAEGWANTFTEDGVFEGSTGRANGREELLDFVRRRDPSNPIRHWNNNIVIEGDGDDATTSVYLLTVDVSDGPKLNRSGIYNDTLKRVGGEWKFTHRKVRPDRKPD